MIKEELFYLTRAIELTVHNFFGLNQIRTDSLIQREYQKKINDWDIYESTDLNLGMRAGKFQSLTIKEMCDAYINLINQEIREFKTVLDAGCGEGVKTIVLKQQNPEKEFIGFDIFKTRIDSAQKTARNKQVDLHFFQGDIRNICLDSKSVDVVYTNMALEQLPNHTEKALNELVRVARRKVVLIEPCYEFGNHAQKQYLIYKDYTRSLKKDIERLQSQGILKIKKASKLESLHNPLNPAAIFVLENLA